MSTYQKALDKIKFLSGQSNITDAEGINVLDMALDDYTDIAIKADSAVKFDDDGNEDQPIAYKAVVSSQHAYNVDISFLQRDQVHIKYDGTWHVLEPVDSREYKNKPLEAMYSTPGKPKYYDADGQTLKLYPAPDWSDSGDLTDTDNLSLKVRHTRPANYVSNLADTLGIPRPHINYLVWHGVHQLMVKTNDPGLVEARNERDRQARQVKDHFTLRDEDRTRLIRPKISSAFTKR